MCFLSGVLFWVFSLLAPCARPLGVAYLGEPLRIQGVVNQGHPARLQATVE